MRAATQHLRYDRSLALGAQPGVRDGRPLESFVIFQFLCQLALLFDLFGDYRVWVRAAVFGSSLLLLLLLPKGRGRPHPATRSAFWIIAILILSFFHPMTNSLSAGMAQIGLYLAIIGPLYWVPRLSVDMTVLRRVLLIIFIFHTCSAATGVLQARFPGSFQPNLSTMLTSQGQGYLESLKITLANGQRVLRPMGLTDTPGGAASAGFYTVLLGIGFYLTSRLRWLRLACLGSILLGMICLYLAQVRSLLVITAICVLAFCLLLIWQKRTAKLIAIGSILAAMIALSFTYAVSLGGKGMTSRLSTLIQDSPQSVYYKNRGIFLEETINVLLPQYPLGAGLGRWGMMKNYFGDNTGPGQSPIYVEIQWTGWLLDGGIPLIVAYVVTILLGLWTAFKIALNRRLDDLSRWGAIVLAYGVGAVVTTFNYPLFNSQSGMEFWLLSAILFAAARAPLPLPGRAKGLRG